MTLYCAFMRLKLLTILILSGGILAGEEPASPEYPLWDCLESVALYAERVHLPPSKTIVLGNGVNLDLVLIPAGKYTMGTPEPKIFDNTRFRKQILIGQGALALGCGVLIFLLGAVGYRALRNRSRPNFSLVRLLAMTIAAGVALMGGLHWRASATLLERAQTDHMAAKERFKVSKNQRDRDNAHEVGLARPFYMGKFEVTQAQFLEVMGRNPSMYSGRDNPVESVSWDDAMEFCLRLSERLHCSVRLPVESEWEFSCRAGTKTVFHSGDTTQDLDRVAWYRANANLRSHPVGQKDPNAFGLFDMHGNVCEWCLDAYRKDAPYKSSNLGPPGLTESGDRAMRGGAGVAMPEDCRSASGQWMHRSVKFNYFGFRVVMDLPSK